MTEKPNVLAFREVHKKPLYELVPCGEDDLPAIRKCFWKYPYLRPDNVENVTLWVKELYDSPKFDLVKIQTVKKHRAKWYGHFDLLGDILGLHAYKPVGQNLNLGAWLRIGAMALDYAFKIWEARKVMTSCPTDMDGYNKMIVALGFMPEGVLREGLVFKGKPQDLYLYGCLKYEFYGEEVENDGNPEKETGGQKTGPKETGTEKG